MLNRTIFMYFYTYELELFLNSKQDELLNLSFQSDEANTDRPFKEFLKNTIEKEFPSIPKNSTIKSVTINGEEHTIDDYSNFKINKVLLSEEIFDELKSSLNDKFHQHFLFCY